MPPMNAMDAFLYPVCFQIPCAIHQTRKLGTTCTLHGLGQKYIQASPYFFPSFSLPLLSSPPSSHTHRNILSSAKANSIIQSDFLHKTCQSIHQATPTSTPTISVWLACIFRIWDNRESIITSWNSLPVVYYINIKNIGFISNQNLVSISFQLSF